MNDVHMSREAMPTVLITGASRGLGLEFSRQYAESGWQVLSTCRSPDDAPALRDLADCHPSLRLHALDVTQDKSVQSLAEVLRGIKIDVLLNNAGIAGQIDGQSLGVLDYRIGHETMETNLFGPLRMAEAFLDHVAASEQRKIMTVSSALGSISSTTGGTIFYRCSKSAVNMAMASLARDVAQRGVIVGLLSPGLVATDLTADLDGPKITPLESISGLIPIIDAYTLEQSGQFIRYTGLEVPW
jgi:NAD(P)-dependent dehydrogenase (short-subunit alcohol dehydrogenase family)